MQVHKYEVHSRLNHLRAASIEARLQLAALYAATGTLLPEPCSQATGAHTAVTLLRHSWVHRPLKQGEKRQLQATAALGGHLVPALHVLVAEQQLSSAEVEFLHQPDDEPRLDSKPASAQPGAQQVAAGGAAAEGKAVAASKGAQFDYSSHAVPTVDDKALSSYTQQQRAAHRLHALCGALDPRVVLDKVEEQRVWGTAPPAPAPPAWMQRGRHQKVRVPPAFSDGADASLVKATEERLLGLLRHAPDDEGDAAPEYPVPRAEEGMRPLQHHMLQELEDSWEAHLEQRGGVATGLQEDAFDVIKDEKVSLGGQGVKGDVCLGFSMQAGVCFWRSALCCTTAAALWLNNCLLLLFKQPTLRFPMTCAEESRRR